MKWKQWQRGLERPRQGCELEHGSVHLRSKWTQRKGALKSRHSRARPESRRESWNRAPPPGVQPRVYAQKQSWFASFGFRVLVGQKSSHVPMCTQMKLHRKSFSETEVSLSPRPGPSTMPRKGALVDEVLKVIFWVKLCIATNMDSTRKVSFKLLTFFFFFVTAVPFAAA